MISVSEDIDKGLYVNFLPGVFASLRRFACNIINSAPNSSINNLAFLSIMWNFLAFSHHRKSWNRIELVRLYPTFHVD